MSDFKSALLTLGDEAFFELVRNYLGPVKTPFNKHDLIARLEGFLRREDIRGRIIELIDDEDAEILTAVWLLGRPDFEELYLFFARERTYLELHQRLLNLEDRLLIYRDHNQLRINPVLVDILEETVLNADRLFVSRPRHGHDPEPRPPWVTDTLLVALYAYAQEHPEVFRADRSIRKRTLNDLTERLPVLVEYVDHMPQVRRATVIIDVLLEAGALTEQAGIHPVTPVWRSLAGLSPLRRLTTVVAALACEQGQPADLLAQAIETVLAALPEDRAMSVLSVERLLVVLAADHSAETCRRARETMTLLGLLIPVDEEYLICAQLPEGHEDTQPLVIQPNFDVMMPEEFAFSDGLLLARIARLTRHDRYPHFELTKDRLAAALRDGEELEPIVDRLRNLSRGTLPQNIVVTMQSWAHEYESIRLFKGVVLQVESARRHAVEHSEVVQALIRRELAPGIYLVDERDVEALQHALEEAGIELVPELATPHRRDEPGFGETARELPFPSARMDTFAQVFSRAPEGDRREAGGLQSRPPEWIKEIEARLDDPAFSDEQREELASRIKNKLIVTADQIKPGSIKTEKTEARGIDYVGKIRVIEHAIHAGTSFLEVIERSGDGVPLRRLVEPKELAKRENELWLIGNELPARTTVELLVRKLGLVRRLRAGLVKRRPDRQ